METTNPNIRIAALVVWSTIVSLFLLYFILLNNQELMSISFVGFVALSFLIFRHKRLFGVLLFSALVFIIVGEIYYFFTGTILWDIQSIGINLSIIGYYLLITSVLSLVLSVAYEKVSRHKGRLVKSINRMKTGTASILPQSMLMVGILLLILPIWPTGVQVHLKQLPYLQLSIDKAAYQQYSGGPYLLDLNLSNYSLLLNPQRSNILFYYRNSTAINTSIVGIAPRAGNITMLIRGGGALSSTTSMLLYFTYFGTGFSNQTSLIESYNQSGAVRISTIEGPLENAYGYANVTERYYGYVGSNITSYSNFTALPYYVLNDVCLPGIAHRSSIRFNATRSTSLFTFQNQSDVSRAVVTGNSYGQSYSYYVARFLNYSTASIINKTTGIINASYNGTCLNHAFVFGKEQHVNVRIDSYYISNRSLTKEVVVPSGIAMSASYGSYSFFPYGIAYLYRITLAS